MRIHIFYLFFSLISAVSNAAVTQKCIGIPPDSDDIPAQFRARADEHVDKVIESFTVTYGKLEGTRLRVESDYYHFQSQVAFTFQPTEKYKLFFHPRRFGSTHWPSVKLQFPQKTPNPYFVPYANHFWMREPSHVEEVWGDLLIKTSPSGKVISRVFFQNGGMFPATYLIQFFSCEPYPFDGFAL